LANSTLTVRPAALRISMNRSVEETTAVSTIELGLQGSKPVPCTVKLLL
jgi:hypothetical protein